MPEGMTGAEYLAMKERPEAKEYRNLLARSMYAARRFDGSEQTYREVMENLIALEEYVKASPHFTAGKITEREAEAAQRFAPLHPRDIGGVLELAIQSRDRKLRRALEKKEESSNFHIRHLDAPILPPGNAPEILKGEHEASPEPTRFEERLKELLALLETIDVFADDLAISIGPVIPGAMRKTSYAAIEIPRLHRTVLVCDQVGEATFVAKGILPSDILTTHTKEQLQERFSGSIVRLIRKDPLSWKKQLSRYLTSDEWENEAAPMIPAGPKVDTRSYIQMRDDIRSRYTPMQWINMHWKEKQTFSIRGARLNRLATLFGVTGLPISNAIPFLEIGFRIWPESQEIREALEIARSKAETTEKTAEEWKSILRSRYTPAEWIAMTTRDFKTVSLQGVGMKRIARAFGLPGDSTSTNLGSLQLGKKIWPDSKEIADALQKQERLPDEWVRRLRSRFTPEQWLGMTVKERSSISVDNVGLKAIARVFGITGNPVSNLIAHFRLGGKIWPEDDGVATAIAVEESRSSSAEKTPDQWLALLRSKYTPDEWKSMTVKQRIKLSFGGIGLTRLSRLFGIAGEPANNSIPHLQLGLKIWPESKEIREALVRLGNTKSSGVVK